MGGALQKMSMVVESNEVDMSAGICVCTRCSTNMYVIEAVLQLLIQGLILLSKLKNCSEFLVG